MEERKLSCGIVKDLLSSYRDELLSEDVKEAVEEHLKECEDCRKALSDYERKQMEDMEMRAAKEEKFVKDAKGVKYYVIGIMIGLIPFFIIVIRFIMEMITIKIQEF